MLRSTLDSDTRVVLIRPASWWLAMAARHREALDAAFVRLPALVAAPTPRSPATRDRSVAMLRFPGQWIADPAVGPRLRDQALGRLEDALRSPLGVGQAVASMHVLGTFHTLAGQAAVLSGDEAGWRSVVLGFRFAATAVVLSDRLFAADPRPGRPPRTNEWEVGHCVALGLALEAPVDQPVFAVFRERMRADTLGGSRGAYAPYLVALLELRAGEATAAGLAARDLGPWTALFAGWSDDVEFAAAVGAALDYRVARASPSSRHLGEFEGGPEQAMPAELVAAARIRAAAGLAVPDLDHALWRSPLVQTRPTGAWPEDQLLSRCVDYAETVEPPHPDAVLAAASRGASRRGLAGGLRRAFGRWLGPRRDPSSGGPGPADR